MKNAIVLESHNEILSAHMRGEYPELALVIPAKEAEPSETKDNISTEKYEVGKYYSGLGVYAGELKKQDGFYGIFAALQDAGEKDEDGDSQEYTWEDTMRLSLPEGYRVPDIRELTLIHLNIDDVNAGLSAAGGEKLEGYYWSSTECNNDSAWRLRMSDGTRDWYGKNYNTYYVRPVLALKL